MFLVAKANENKDVQVITFVPSSKVGRGRFYHCFLYFPFCITIIILMYFMRVRVLYSVGE